MRSGRAGAALAGALPLVALLLALGAGPARAQSAAAPSPAGLLRAMHLQSGRWHSTLTVTDMEVEPEAEGRRPQASTQRALQGARRQFETDDCLGDSLAADGALVLPGIGIAAGCAFDAIDALDGHLHLIATCGRRGDGFESRTILDATYAPTTMNSHVVSTVHSRAEGGTLTRTIVAIDSTYAGRCG